MQAASVDLKKLYLAEYDKEGIFVVRADLAKSWDQQAGGSAINGSSPFFPGRRKRLSSRASVPVPSWAVVGAWERKDPTHVLREWKEQLELVASAKEFVAPIKIGPGTSGAPVIYRYNHYWPSMFVIGGVSLRISRDFESSTFAHPEAIRELVEKVDGSDSIHWRMKNRLTFREGSGIREANITHRTVADMMSLDSGGGSDGDGGGLREAPAGNGSDGDGGLLSTQHLLMTSPTASSADAFKHYGIEPGVSRGKIAEIGYFVKNQTGYRIPVYADFGVALKVSPPVEAIISGANLFEVLRQRTLQLGAPEFLLKGRHGSRIDVRAEKLSLHLNDPLNSVTLDFELDAKGGYESQGFLPSIRVKSGSKAYYIDLRNLFFVDCSQIREKFDVKRSLMSNVSYCAVKGLKAAPSITFREIGQENNPDYTDQKIEFWVETSGNRK